MGQRLLLSRTDTDGVWVDVSNVALEGGRLRRVDDGATIADYEGFEWIIREPLKVVRHGRDAQWTDEVPPGATFIDVVFIPKDAGLTGLPWQQIGDAHMLTSLRVEGVMLHLEAIRVREERDTQVIDADGEQHLDLNLLHSTFAADGLWDTAIIPGHKGEWLLFASPYC